MNHTVSFIQSASPLMESIHKWSFNSNRTHTTPRRPPVYARRAPTTLVPEGQPLAVHPRPHPPDTPARLICIRDILKRSSVERSSTSVARR